jgi:hypothetical protein
MLIKIHDVGLNTEISQGQSLKQLDNEQREVSVNQNLALNCTLNFFKSYFLNAIYPTELITFLGGQSLD